MKAVTIYDPRGGVTANDDGLVLVGDGTAVTPAGLERAGGVVRRGLQQWILHDRRPWCDAGGALTKLLNDRHVTLHTSHTEANRPPTTEQ